MPQQNWVPRTFGLTHGGILLYYEAATVQEAANAAGGLGVPRQFLNLRAANVRAHNLSCVSAACVRLVSLKTWAGDV